MMALKAEDRIDLEEKVLGSDVQPKLGTGLQIWSGTIQDEYLSELRPWDRAYKIFREMRDSAVIGGMLEAIKTPLLSASFEIRPAGSSDEQRKQADFLQSCTLDGLPDMDWREHVEEMLDFVDFGFSLAEKVLYKHKDGSLRIRALIPIGQDTLYRWGDPDDFGRVTSFLQQDIISSWRPKNKPSIREAPMDKLLHFTWRPKKRSPMGSPMLRSLYRSYYFVKNLEAIEAIGAERDIGGAPVVKLGPGFYTPTQLTNIENALKGLRMDESLYLILPHGMEIEPFASGGKIYNVRLMIRDYQHLIRQRFFTDFLALGSEQVGTQSLAREMTSFFSLALRAVQGRMLEVWNHQLVPWLFRWNGIELPRNQLPIIAWSNPGRYSVQALAQTLTTLVNGQLLTKTPHTESMLRTALDLPQLPAELVQQLEQIEVRKREAQLTAPPKVDEPIADGSKEDPNVSGDDTGVKNRQGADGEQFVEGRSDA